MTVPVAPYAVAGRHTNFPDRPEGKGECAGRNKRGNRGNCGKLVFLFCSEYLNVRNLTGFTYYVLGVDLL